MGDSYKIIEIEKRLKNKFKNLNLNFDFVEGRKVNIFFDVGFGEKFVIFVLPLESNYDLESLLNFSSLEVLFESIRRFIQVNPPKGFRVRFVITDNNDNSFTNLRLNTDKLGREDRILMILNIKETGVGNEKIVINGLESDLIFKINKLIKENGLNTKLIRWKEDCMADKISNINVLEFKTYPNNFANILPKDFFDKKRVAYITTLISLIVTQVFKL